MGFAYPESLPLSRLDNRESGWAERQQFCRQIELLYEGGKALLDNKEDFIRKRVGEESEAYMARKGRVSYDPVFADEVGTLTDRLLTAPIGYEGEGLPTEFVDWTENVDRLGTDLKDWLAEDFKRYVRHGIAFVFVDSRGGDGATNMLQQEMMGVEARIVRLSCWDVVGYQCAGDKVLWLEYFETFKRYEEVGKPGVDWAVWTFVDDERIAKYASRVRLGEGGKILAIESEDRDMGGPDGVEAPLVSVVEHGRGVCPVVKMEADDPTEWVGNQVFPMAWESFDLESGSWDNASTAGYAARTFKPFVEDESDLTKVGGKVPSRAGWYAGEAKFAEFSGNSIKVVDEKNERIKNRIRAIINNAGLASLKMKVLEQSGKSKAYDEMKSELALEGYGGVLLGYYQRVIDMVAGLLGVGAIRAIGLDDFDIADIDRLTAQVEGLIKIAALVPLPLAEFLMQKLQRAIAGNANEALNQQISSSGVMLSSITSPARQAEPNPAQTESSRNGATSR